MPTELELINILGLAKHPLVSELVVIETCLDQGLDDNYRKLLDMCIEQNISLKYDKILKSRFNHGSVRNQLFGMCSEAFVCFTTQDVIFPKSLDLFSLVRTIQVQGLDGICLRHASHYPSFNQLLESLFTSLASEQLKALDGMGINWWSHNFAIYRHDLLRKIKFLDIPYGEDHYFKIQADAAGYKLRVIFSSFIIHQNIEAFNMAWRRGKLEAKGHFLAHQILKFHPKSFGVYHYFYSLFQNFKYVKLVQNPIQIAIDLHFLSKLSLGRLAFYVQWNQFCKNSK